MQEKIYRDTIKAYDKLGKGYIKKISKVFPAARTGFVKNLPKRARILDVGCAGGRDSEKFVKEGFKVTGIDLSEIFLKIARKKVPKAKFIKMDVRELKFPKENFDAIWAQAVLLHLDRKDIPKVMKSFYKILSQGGILDVTIKIGKGATFLEENIPGGYKRFYTYFSKKEAENFFKKSGFKIVYSKILPPVSVSEPDVEWLSILSKK